MPHPLVGDLSQLSVDELYAKFAELNRKMSMAYRMGYGDAVQQMQMLIVDYQQEINNRNDKMMQEMAEKTPEFAHIIDVTR